MCNIATKNNIEIPALYIGYPPNGPCRALFVVQPDLRCCGGESAHEQHLFALRAPYDMVVSEGHLYTEMEMDHYEYLTVLRRPLDLPDAAQKCQ